MFIFSEHVGPTFARLLYSSQSNARPFVFTHLEIHGGIAPRHKIPLVWSDPKTLQNYTTRLPTNVGNQPVLPVLMHLHLHVLCGSNRQSDIGRSHTPARAPGKGLLPTGLAS